MNQVVLLDELPEQFLDRSFAGGGARNQTGITVGIIQQQWVVHLIECTRLLEQEVTTLYRPHTKQKTAKKPAYLAPNTKTQTVEHKPSADFVASDTSNLKVGQKVEHQKFGFGEVIKMEGSTHNPIATIKFELNGEKKIMLNYAKLRIVE